MHSLKPNVWVKLSKVHQNFQVIAGKQEMKPASKAQVILCSLSGPEEMSSEHSLNEVKSSGQLFPGTSVTWVH